MWNWNPSKNADPRKTFSLVPTDSCYRKACQTKFTEKSRELEKGDFLKKSRYGVECGKLVKKAAVKHLVLIRHHPAHHIKFKNFRYGKIVKWIFAIRQFFYSNFYDVYNRFSQKWKVIERIVSIVFLMAWYFKKLVLNFQLFKNCQNADDRRKLRLGLDFWSKLIETTALGSKRSKTVSMMSAKNWLELLS